jgi:stearoyl-CoA desaturase (delta-9 desaturase)
MGNPSYGKYRPGVVGVFLLIHIVALGVFLVPFRVGLLWWLLATYSLRMFGVTAGYHRYFSHRSYKMGRTAQFLMAVLAQTSGQKGILWWAAQHRIHHRHSDREADVHSPVQRGFWWSHAGWVLSNEFDAYDTRSVADFGKFPELRWLDKHHWVPGLSFSILMGLISLAAYDAGIFLWGYVLSTVLVYHCTFAINSFAHIFGSQRFDTADDSRNNWWLALITFGEGWHNNHHFSISSCRQGYRWWEIDITYYLLKILSWFGIARDLRPFRVPRPGNGARRAA